MKKIKCEVTGKTIFTTQADANEFMIRIKSHNKFKSIVKRNGRKSNQKRSYFL
jgi:hypothetical protein